MLRVECNIADVLRQTDRLRTAIPEAVRAALRADLWVADAKLLAHRVLSGLATAEQQPLVGPFVAAITAADIEDGFLLALQSPHLPQTGALNLPGFVANAKLAALPLFAKGLLQDRAVAQQIVRDWVVLEKDIDERDLNDDGTLRTVDEITAHLMTILFGKGDRWEEARESLLKSGSSSDAKQHSGLHLLDFFAAHPLAQGAGGGDWPATVDRWLRAVLEAWGHLVRAKLPARIRARWRQLTTNSR